MSNVVLDTGLTLSCWEQGDASEPAVLLLPGPTDSWRSYEPVLEHLPSHLRVVAVSQRGHGDSDKPDTGYRVDDFADDVVPLLNALRIERAVLVGHSGSCLTVRRVALDHPGRVAGLLLEASPATLRDDPRLVDLIDSVVSELDDPISPEVARSFVAGTSSSDLPPDLVDTFVRDVLEVPAHVWKEMFVALLEYDDLAELPGIGAPALLIWGDADSLIARAEQD